MAEIANTGTVRVRDEPDDRGFRWPVYRPPTVLETATGVAAVALAAGVAAIVLTGDVVAYPDAFSVVLVTNIVGLTTAGLLWLRARPASPFGRLLLVLAGVSVLVGLSGARSPALHLGGTIMQWAFAILATWVVAAFPNGRLDRAARAVVALPIVVFAFCQVPQLLFSSTATGASIAGRCASAATCPHNPLTVALRPGLAHDFALANDLGRSVWGVALVAYIVARFVRASRPSRRLLLPVFGVASVYAGSFAAAAFAIDALGLPGVSTPIRNLFIASRIAFPFGFVAAILLAHAYAGTALAEMSRELGQSPSVASVEAIVRRVLDDPRARLAFWVPRFGGYADRHGRAVELAPKDEWRSWRAFRRGSGKLLAIEHDPALSENAELIDAVGAAATMALENRRLQRGLLDSISELRASQRRLVMAAALERRRIERDLHDSAQQRLVAIRIQLELAREQATEESDLRDRLARLGDDLDEALDELRAVAHGIHPQLLTEGGLPAALAEAARHVGVPVELRLGDVGRWPEELETAVYYCCLEALQNVVKHGGDGVTATLTLWRDAQWLRFSVVDDGRGFAMSHRSAGAGLTNMADRIGAVGGAVSIRSTIGQGTSVEGRVALDHGDGDESHAWEA